MALALQGVKVEYCPVTLRKTLDHLVYRLSRDLIDIRRIRILFLRHIPDTLLKHYRHTSSHPPDNLQALIYQNSSHAAEQDSSLRKEKGTHVKAEAPDNKPKAAEASSPASFPNYLPGFEPENVKPALDRFLAVMEREYPDHVIAGSSWDHDKWDKAASMLCKVLGYSSGSDFLEAYGFTVEKER